MQHRAEKSSKIRLYNLFIDTLPYLLTDDLSVHIVKSFMS